MLAKFLTLFNRILRKLNKHTKPFLYALRILFIGFFSLVCLASCDPDDEVMRPEDFQKSDQERLGYQIWSALTASDSSLDILNPEEHVELYQHIESLHRQSYFILRAKQGWSVERDWKISIFKEENQAAFSLPGGNMLISTGMLKAFRKEYELFYLLSFENSLMDSGYLFANILTFIEDSIDIDRLINDGDVEMANQIGMEIYNLLEFNAFMSSINRLSTVTANFLALDCDNDTRITSLGNDFYVNEILPLIP